MIIFWAFKMSKDNFMGRKNPQQDSIYKLRTDSSSQGLLEMDTDVLLWDSQVFYNTNMVTVIYH